MKIVAIPFLLIFLSLNVLSQECTIGDCKNDYGVYIWKGGEKYVGYWKDGKQDGNGTYYYSNGAKFKGTWKLGEKDGVGFFTDAKGKTSEIVWNSGKRIYKKNNLYEKWLLGIWKGTGYQLNGDTWKVVLYYNDKNDIRISYLDFPCNGYWSYDRENTKQIFYNEKITKGQHKWIPDIKIVIQKENENIMGVYFFSDKKQIASANLVRN